MAEKQHIEADLVADTRDSERRLGFRNATSEERRLLFQAGEAYVELRVPPASGEDGASGWLYGQVIQPDGTTSRLESPMYAVLQGHAGVTGAVRTTEVGDFAVPIRGRGDFVLDIEPSAGPVIRARFHQ